MAAAIVAARTGRKIAAQKRKARERWHESVAAHLREDVLDAFTSVDDDEADWVVDVNGQEGYITKVFGSGSVSIKTK